MSTGSISYAVERKILQSGAFVANTDFISIGVTTEYSFFYFKNPNTNKLKSMVTHIAWGVDSISTRSTIRIYKHPTVTNDGTPVDIHNTLIKTPEDDSTMLCFSEPTVTDKGEQLTTNLIPENSTPRGISRTFVLEPDNSMLITMENNIANVDTFLEMLWVEI